METLTLVLDGDEENCQIHIAACDQVLARASPFFRAMLQRNGFKEGNALMEKACPEIALPETNAKAMQVLCDIFHLNSDKVPVNTMTSDLLFEIATLVDKYDCARAIQPWPQIWLTQEALRDEIAKPADMELDEVAKWIHIASQLGYSTEFEELTSRLLSDASLDDIFLPPLRDRFELLDHTLQDGILKQRKECASQLYNAAMTLVLNLEDGDSCQYHKRTGYQTNDEFDCSSMLLGNTLLALRQEFGPQWRDENQWNVGTVLLYERMNNIAAKLKGTRWIAAGQTYHYNNPGSGHYLCSRQPELVQQIDFTRRNTSRGLRLSEHGNSFYRKAADTNKNLPCPTTSTQHESIPRIMNMYTS